MLVPLAGGGGQETLLSEIGALHLLPLFTTREACALRLVCREFLAAVTEQPWEDGATAIQGSLAACRACFPRALFANVARMSSCGGEVRTAPVADADFVHLAGLRELNLLGCWGVTDAAFVHLRGIRSLEMCLCHRVTDAAFVHLRGIHLLDMSPCLQLTDAAFVHLRGIRTLNMSQCIQPAITDAAFVHLRGIRTLVMWNCAQATVTGATFGVLAGVGALIVQECNGQAQAAARALRLPVPRSLIDLGWPDCSNHPWRVPRSCLWTWPD